MFREWPERTKRLAIAACFCAVFAHAQGIPYGPDDRGVFGGGRRVRIEDLPISPLRDQLERLSPVARERGLRWLESFRFHKNDVRSLRADPEGGIYYVCDFGLPADSLTAEVRSEALSLVTSGGPLPISEVPIFHSKPGSTNVLFLDFNGHVVSNTYWNIAYTTSVWRARPFDIDGDETTFSELEQRYIREIWERVAEDFAPFDVNVTTEQPASWNRRTGHALITPWTDADGRVCPHNGYGGIAYVAVFNHPSYSYDAANCYSPAWVAVMAGNNYANTAEAVSHELGHNLGLSHDGTSTLEYYPGHAGTTNAPSWAPIMGSAYGKNVSQWSKGEYYDANQPEDDLAIISSLLPYRADDVSNALEKATLVVLSNNTFAVSGRIHSSTDEDVWVVPAGAGPITVGTSPYQCTSGTWGANADLVLLLESANGSVVASNNPPAFVHAQVSATVSMGFCYLRVRPCGAGFPTNSSPSGYTVYGSLGTYTLTGQVSSLGNAILLHSPRAGETWYRSNLHTIAWVSGFTNSVCVELFRYGLLDTVLTSNAPGSGSFTWFVPWSQRPSTNYYIRVRRCDDPSVYATSGPIRIGTTSMRVFYDDFEAGGSFAPGWSQQVVSGSATWQLRNGGGSSGGVSPPSAFSGTNNAILYRNVRTANRTRLIARPLNLSELTNAVLSFQHHMAKEGTDQDELAVYYRLNAESWNLLASYTNNVSPWTLRMLTLPVLGSNVTVCFEGNAKGGYGVCVDDVAVVGYLADPPELPLHELVVVSDYGQTQPAVGSHWFTNAQVVSISVLNPSVVAGATQWVCVGWTGQGSVPNAGTGTATQVVLTTDSIIRWRWITNYYFVCQASSGGFVSASSGWYAFGGSVTVTAVPVRFFEFLDWQGDVQGDPRQPVTTVLVNGPLSLLARFAEQRAPLGTPLTWLAGHFPETNDYAAAELSDDDQDGMPAWQEFLAGTNPRDGASCLTVVNPSRVAQGIVLGWPVVSGRVYSLYWLPEITNQGFERVWGPTRADRDDFWLFTNEPNGAPVKGFYRVGVRAE